MSTESLIDDIPTFTETGHQNNADDLGVNTEFEALLASIDEPEQTEGEAKTGTEKGDSLTESTAKELISGAANALCSFAGMVTGTKVQVSSFEVDDLANSLAPAVMKYANEVGEMPPWIKGLLQYRVELIALKGVILFGVSLWHQIKTQKQQLALEKAKAAKAKAEANKAEPDTEISTVPQGEVIH